MIESIESLSLVSLVLAGVCISVVIVFWIYLRVRPRFPIRVNCWFCNRSTDVPYDNRNSWDCPHCEQYNGFSPDGGYNKVIPAQHDELLNYNTANSSFTKKSLPNFAKSPLCRKCNINQELKIQQLASFTPRDPASFDEEIEEYRQHLERAYQLCHACEKAVQHTLHLQQGWLLGQHRRLAIAGKTRVMGVAAVVGGWWRRWPLPLGWLQRLHLATALVGGMVLVATVRRAGGPLPASLLSPDLVQLLGALPQHEAVLALGMATLLAVATTTCPQRARVDMIAVVLWLALLGHGRLLALPALHKLFSHTDLLTAHMSVVGVTVVVNLLAAMGPRHMDRARRQHKQRLLSGRNITEHFSSPGISFREELQVPPSSLHDLVTPFAALTPESQSPGLSPAPSPARSPSLGHSPRLFPKQSPSSGPCPAAWQLEWGLGRLTLGPGGNSSRPRSVGSVFETRSYGSGQTETSSSSRRGPLLRPPRLQLSSPIWGRRSVTQSSWVAGGYWRELGGSLTRASALEASLAAATTPTAGSGAPTPGSCSSSRSSGFCSRSSQSPASVANSYSGSLCGGAEADRLSLLSEPGASALSPVPAPASTPYFGLPLWGGFPVCMGHACAVACSRCPSPGTCSPPTPVLSPSPALVPALAPSPAWGLMRQHLLLGVLFVGSLLVNLLGFTFLLYKNASVVVT